MERILSPKAPGRELPRFNQSEPTLQAFDVMMPRVLRAMMNSRWNQANSDK